jgi:hypothetical protein
MQKIPKLVLYGVLSWLVPFIIAIPFYSPSGEPLIAVPLFKSLMVVTGAATGAILLILYFRGVTGGYLRAGAMAGLVWLLINWVLDLAILLPLSGQTISEYGAQIGLRYLNIPIMGMMLGYGVAEAVRKTDGQG